MTISYWNFHRARTELAVDIAIVGAGITGSSTAYWIRKLAPDRSACIIDAGSVASGATGRNAGFLLQGSAGSVIDEMDRHGEELVRRIWDFTAENIHLVRNELSPDAIDLECNGSIFCAGSEAEADLTARIFDVLKSWAVNVEPVDEEKLRQMTGGRHFSGGLYFPGNCTVHPLKMVSAIVQKSGAQILDFDPVYEIDNQGEGLTLMTARHVVKAERLIVAANAFLPGLFSALGAYVRPVRAQMLATSPGRRRSLNFPVYSHEGYYYVRQMEDGAVLAGGARHLHKDEEVGFTDLTTDAVQRDIESYLAHHFPDLAEGPIRLRWSGVMGFSPDGLPIVSDVPGLHGAWWVGGYSGHGMAYGFLMGKLMAQVALGQEPSELELFSVNRFKR